MPWNFIPLLVSPVPRVLCVQNPNYFGYGRRLAANTTPNRRLQVALSRASVRSAEATVVISHSLHREMVGDGLSSDRVIVVRSGAPKWDVAAEKPSAAPERPFFLSLANDYAHKRLRDLVEGWSLAKSRTGDEFPGLVLVGSIASPRREQLRAVASCEPSGDGLSFLGSVRSRSNVRWLLENCVATVATSELEALPLVPIEAGSLGTRAVLTDIPPHREVADGYATFFDVGDCDVLADRLLEVATDRIGRSPMGWPMTWDEDAHQLLEVFERAAARRRGSLNRVGPVATRARTAVHSRVFPRLFRATPRDDVTRLGSAGGGWWVPRRHLSADSVCYLAGVGEDISFDLALIDAFGCAWWQSIPRPRRSRTSRSGESPIRASRSSRTVWPGAQDPVASSLLRTPGTSLTRSPISNCMSSATSRRSAGRWPISCTSSAMSTSISSRWTSREPIMKCWTPCTGTACIRRSSASSSTNLSRRHSPG